MRWIESLGGPLVLLPEEHLRCWRGSADGSAHYDRACGVEDYLGIIPCAHFNVLVLGDEPLRTAWVPHGDAGMFVRWVYADTEDEVEEAASWARASAVAAPTELVLELVGRQRLQDASASGERDHEEHLAIEVAPGSYRLHSGTITSGDHLKLLVHLLLPTLCDAPEDEAQP